MTRKTKSARIFNGKRYIRRGKFKIKQRAEEAKARYHGRGINALVIQTSKNNYTLWTRIPDNYKVN